MKWILILYWSLHGEVVLNHLVFDGRPACEERLAALRGVFEFMDHADWSAVCQPEKAPDRSGAEKPTVPR